MLVLSLRVGLALGVAARATELAFSRLGFCELLVSSRVPGVRRAFVRSLLATIRAKLLCGELRAGPVIRWVARLVWSAWSLPPVTTRFVKQHGFEPPAFLVVSATERCNFECAHCYGASSARASTTLDYRTFDELLRRQREEWGASLVVVTGGEPFLYATRRGDLFTLARKHSATLFVVYTNGSLISDEVAERLANLGNVIPLVSLEGDERETSAVRGRRAWPAAMTAMERLRACGVLFGVSLTASRANARLLATPDYYRALRDDHGATFFWVLERASLGRATARDDRLSLPEKTELQRALAACVARSRLLITSFLHAPGAFSGCLADRRVDRFFYVDAWGEIRHCVYSPLPVGNAKQSFARAEKLSSFLFEAPSKALRDAQQAFFTTTDPLVGGGSHLPCPIVARSEHSLPLVS